MLLSYERRLLADFILFSKEQRKATLQAAQRDPQTSGPLIQAYRWALDL